MTKQKQDIYKTGLTQKFGRPVLSKGFTLVELIVVITILAILGTIAIMAFSGYSKNARDSVRVTDISNIMKGVELYSLKAGNYPEPDEAVVYTGGTSSSIKQGKIGDLVSSNINISGDLVDPLTQKKYVYSVFGNSKYYQIGAEKENDQALLIDSAYAESGKVIVKGNYMFDPSLPSLIVVPSSVTGSGIFDPSVCFVIDGGVNTFDTCVEKKSEMVLKSQDSNLVGYWDMESIFNSGGIDYLKDLSGNGNDGIFSGGILSGNTGGLLGKGMTFASNQYVLITSTGSEIANLGKIDYSYSIGFTLNLSNYLPGTYLIALEKIYSTAGNPLYPILIYYWDSSSGYLRNFVRAGEKTSLIGNYNSLTDFQNISIVIDRNQNQLLYYINGVIYKKNDISDFQDMSNLEDLIIGNRNTTASNSNWYGIIDDVKIYNRALSDEEILQQAKIAGF